MSFFHVPLKKGPPSPSSFCLAFIAQQSWKGVGLRRCHGISLSRKTISIHEVLPKKVTSAILGGTFDVAIVSQVAETFI